jgi:hypothetical protein
MNFYHFIPVLFIIMNSFGLDIVTSQAAMNFQNQIAHLFSIFNLFGKIFWHHIHSVLQNLQFSQFVNLHSILSYYFKVLIL